MQKRSLLSAIEYLQRSPSQNLEPLAAVWPPSLPKDRWKLAILLERNQTPPTVFEFQNGNVTQVGSLVWLDSVHIDRNRGARVLEGRSSTYTLRTDGPFLNVEGEGTIARFDLSPLLTMQESVPRDKNPILSSSEGRRGDLIVRRLE